jgi:hypothetical protein
MKTYLLILLTLTIFISLPTRATNYTNNGTPQAYNLSNSDTLRIANGTFTGQVNTFANGAVIVVSAGTTFKPGYFASPSGKIINHGTCEFGALGTYGGFAFENFNQLIVTSNLNLYDGSTQTWNNNATATIKITGSFSMNNAVFTNYATVTIGGNFAMYTATSSFLNRGLLSITGDVSVNAGILSNQNRIYADEFNAYGGQVINEGSISPAGNMTFNTGTNYTNQCLLITNRGFTNYGNFANNGLLWVGRTGTANDHFYNSGTFTNSTTAVVRSVKFTNYSTIAGGGSYYITGDSYTSGTVGRTGTTTDSIRVYDVTRTSASRIFDTQYGSVHPNTVYRTFAQPDTNTVNYAGCSSYYKMDLGTLLPIEWNYFDVKLVQNKPVISWSTQYEANMKFEIERSYDNLKFVTAGSQISNASKNYTFTDNAERAVVLYYRIKATSAVNGAVKYTETKTVKIAASTTSTLAVYPNPVKDAANFTFTSDRNEQVIVRVRNAGGQIILSRNIIAAKGANVFTLSEVAQLNAGIYIVELINAASIIASERFIKN